MLGECRPRNVDYKPYVRSGGLRADLVLAPSGTSRVSLPDVAAGVGPRSRGKSVEMRLGQKPMPNKPGRTPIIGFDRFMR